jgi:hypothetical protein
MPTTRPRHTVTETLDIKQALDAAARRWPQARGARGKLLIHLVHEGHRAIRDLNDDETQARRQAIRRTAGALTGTYGPNALKRLREDWPD